MKGTDHGATAASRPLRVFISYSHKDDELRQRLVTALSQLQRDGLIECWDDREITGGTEWAGTIDERLNAADLVVLLVSADFIASRYCYDVEMQRALERHDKREARVVPIVLRPCDWKTSPLAKLNALPKGGKAAVDWPSPDHAFLNVAQGLRAISRELMGLEQARPPVTGGLAHTRSHRLRTFVFIGLGALVLVGLAAWFWSFEHQNNLQIRDYIAQGKDLLNVGRYEDARKPFQETLGADPANAEAKLGIGIADLAASRSDGVAFQQRLAEMLKRWPNESHLRVLNGDNLLGQGRTQEAESEYNEAIKLNGNLAEAYFRLGVMYDKEGRIGHALGMDQKAVDLSPYSAQYRDNLADAYFKHGEYGKAVEEYGRIPRFPLAALEGANVNRLMGKLDEAREEEMKAIGWLSDKAVAILPENQLPWYFTHEAEGVSIASLDEKLCYARFELSATVYLQGDASPAADDAKQALQACGSQSTDVKTAVQWEMERVASERDELKTRAEGYGQRFLGR